MNTLESKVIGILREVERSAEENPKAAAHCLGQCRGCSRLARLILDDVSYKEVLRILDEIEDRIICIGDF